MIKYKYNIDEIINIINYNLNNLSLINYDFNLDYL